MDTSCSFFVRLCRFELQSNVDATDHEDVVLQLNFAGRFRDQSLIRGVYMARLQRASEGSSKSTRSSSNNIIQGSSVRFQNGFGNLVVLSYGAVDSEDDRLVFLRKIRSTHRALHSLNTHMRPVNYFGHYCWIVSRKAFRNRHPESIDSKPSTASERFQPQITV